MLPKKHLGGKVWPREKFFFHSPYCRKKGRLFVQFSIITHPQAKNTLESIHSKKREF